MPIFSISKFFIFFGAFLGFLGVIFGAFGSHFLKTKLSPELLNAYEIGIKYQFYHALALLVVGVLIHLEIVQFQWLQWGGYAFIAGIFIFSGSLYILALTGNTSWGAITPIGGMSLILGWFFLLLSLR